MAVDMFLELTKIDGEAQDKTHKGKIDVLAWSWGASQAGTTHMGGGGGSGKANVSDISVTKYVDKSSARLLEIIMKGEHIDEGKLIVRKAGDKPLEYIVIELKDIIVTSVSKGGSGGEDRLTENITLNFSEFHYKYTPQKADGSGEAVKEVHWNIAENAPA